MLEHEFVQKDNMEIAEADASIYPARWISRSRVKDEPASMLTLIEKVAKVKDERVFSLQITQVLINSAFEMFSIPIQIYVFLPFIGWLFVTLIYFMNCVQVENHNTAWNVISFEFWLRHLNILLSLYFGKYEVGQMIESPMEYLTDIFNYFNLA